MRAAMFVLVAGLAFPSIGVRADDPPKSWEFVGVTRAAATSDVRAQVTGYVTRVAVKEGDAVAQGDLLIEIDSRAARLDLDAAQARLKVAEAKLQTARIKLANAKRLLENKVVGADDLALNTAAEVEAEATLMGAKVEVQRAELTLSWTRISAPFHSRVSHLQVTQGDLVTADETHILTIVSTDTLHVSFNVPEGLLMRLRRDRLADPSKLDVAVGFALDEGHPHTAKLDLIEPEVNSQTGNARFQATVANAEGLLSPGMSAKVRLTPAPK